MNCSNHKKIEATKTCVGCGSFFCDSCLTKVSGRNYCKDCAGQLLEEKEETEREKKSSTQQPQIIIQQQQQQQQAQQTVIIEQKPRGSYCWLCFWALVFFPVAIVYWFMRRWD